MKYKSESGMSIDKINQYVRVENEIFIDKKPEHNGYNIDIQKYASQVSMDFHTTDTYYPCNIKAGIFKSIIK